VRSDRDYVFMAMSGCLDTSSLAGFLHRAAAYDKVVSNSDVH
jgi:hypothetical protein